MKRTTIWLTESQVTAIARMAKKTGLKQAELIRRLIDVGLNNAFEPAHAKFKKTQPYLTGRRQRKVQR